MATFQVVTGTDAAGNMFFQDVTSGTPDTTIAVGDTVEWSAPDDDHSVVSDNVAPFDTLNPPLNGKLPQGGKHYTYTFSKAGTYGYHCGIHGGDPANKVPMYGVIHVQ